VKFGKKPRFVKRNEPQAPLLQQPSQTQKVTSTTTTSTISVAATEQTTRQQLAKRRMNLKSAAICTEIPIRDYDTSQCLQISSLSPTNMTHDDDMSSLNIFTKSMQSFYDAHPHDWRGITDGIMKDIVRRNLSIKWDEIVGLDDAKMILRESVIFPMKYPQLFNRMQSWRGNSLIFHVSFSTMFHPLNYLFYFSCFAARR
jgi:SpoVK/Ycf46/Vps4 family AAA+-type ATPase